VEADVKIARAFGLEHASLLSSIRRESSAHGHMTSLAFACVRRPSCGNDAFLAATIFRHRLRRDALTIRNFAESF